MLKFSNFRAPEILNSRTVKVSTFQTFKFPNFGIFKFPNVKVYSIFERIEFFPSSNRIMGITKLIAFNQFNGIPINSVSTFIPVTTYVRMIAEKNNFKRMENF